jgi:DNA polymerase III delta prime subunit
MKNLEHSIWAEKYRPTKIADCILPDVVKNALGGMASQEKLSTHLLLSGPAGGGKTTAAKALCKELDYDFMVINGSNEGRLIDTLRTKITQFASTVSFSGNNKAIILDECDFMPADTVQPALRNFMDEYGINCTFILTCNFPNRLLEPIISRCTHIDFTVPSNENNKLVKEFYERIVHILKENNVEYDKLAVGKIVKKYFPDFRKTLNELQKFAGAGKIDSSSVMELTNNIEPVIKFLKDKNFVEMRKWVASTPNIELTSLNKKIYEHANTFISKDSIPQLVLHLSDHDYKNYFCSDKEINIVAMFTRIMMDCETI